MALAFERSESHPLVDALLRTRVPQWQELNRAIDERDDMLDYALHLFDRDRDRALASYFQNGLEQLSLLKHIARWRGPVRTMLDFASGYGRLTRFLVHEHFAGAITVSDILEGGMEFQREQFGVRTILSTPHPELFAAGERYDLIFVASLFTHLPPATFTPWLRRLAALLEPEGLLIFSVHDESLAPAPFDGIYFASTSESRVLDLEDYGSTWVTERYVRNQVASIGAHFACIRLQRALADWQDVYVLSPSPIEHPAPRATLKGFVDQFAVTDQAVRIAGWASAVSEPADRVEIRLDDRLVASIREFAIRPDVAAWVGVDTALVSGWLAEIPHSLVRSFRYQVVTISAFAGDGQERILYVGTLDSLKGHVAHERANELEQQLVLRASEITALSEQLAAEQARANGLDATIAAMKQSRFWRARDRWFALKRAAGLTQER